MGRSFRIGAVSHVGRVKKMNQDKILIKVGEEEAGDFGLFIVADGMGGLAKGEKASQMIINEFVLWWDRRLPMLFEKGILDKKSMDQELRQAALDANKKVLEFGDTIKEKVGSTLSAMFIYKDWYVIKHIGDSRIYKISDAIKQLTEDHSLIAQKIKEGLMTREEARNHPQKNILTRCMGVEKEIVLFEVMGEIHPMDAFLLCSDGFYHHLEDSEIYREINKSRKEYDRDIQRLTNRLLEKVQDRGALDNVSAVIICQEDDNRRKEFSISHWLNKFIGSS